jgi:sulfocyanin
VTTQGKVVHLAVIAGWNNVNAGFNFNGAAHGQMVVTVPLGDKVIGTFKDNVTTPHNVVIIPYTTLLPGSSLPPAFRGAASPTPQFRPGAGAPSRSNKPQTFTFVANKAGTYMIICGVPGHALAGMWDTFVVSRTARVASVTFT